MGKVATISKLESPDTTVVAGLHYFLRYFSVLVIEYGHHSCRAHLAKD